MLSSSFVAVNVVLEFSAPALPAPTIALIVSVVIFGVIGSVLLSTVPEAAKDRTIGSNGQQIVERISSPDPIDELKEEDTHENSDQKIAVDRGGMILYLKTVDIVYIQADSHYSQIFDGTEVFFCKSSLAELEKQLPVNVFFRSHRSFIANLNHVKMLEKKGKHGRIYFGETADFSIPVSRRNLKAMNQLLLTLQQ